MSQQNITTLQANINSQIADNTSGDISAADVRDNLINMTDSLLFNSGSVGITGSLTIASGSISDQYGTGSINVRSVNNLRIPSLILSTRTGPNFKIYHNGDNNGQVNYSGGTLTVSGDSGLSLTGGNGVNIGDQLTSTTSVSGSLTIESNGVADSEANALIIKKAIFSQTSGSIDVTSTSTSRIPSFILRNSDNTSVFKIIEAGTDNVQIDLSGGGTNNLALSAGGKLELFSLTNVVVISSTLPTSEPTASGQLWVSGSAGSNSKILCIRN